MKEKERLGALFCGFLGEIIITSIFPNYDLSVGLRKNW